MVDQAARQLRGDRRDVGQRRHCAVAPAQQQGPYGARVCARAADAHRHRHAAVRLIELRRHAAVKGRIHGLQHVRSFKAVQSQLLGKQFDMQLHLPRRNGQAHITAIRQVLQHLDDLGTDPIVGIEIGTDHADREGADSPDKVSPMRSASTE